MTDADGKPIRANGQNGKDGQDGKPGQSAPTPQLKTGSTLPAAITQDMTGAPITADAIYLSIDSGNTWARVSGEDGADSTATTVIADVQTSADGMYVEFTLAGNGNNKLTVPLYMELGLKFSHDVNEEINPYTSTINIDTSPVISYQFVGTAAASSPRVSALFSDADRWKATVDQTKHHHHCFHCRRERTDHYGDRQQRQCTKLCIDAETDYL